MPRYHITQRETSAPFGEYEGTTPEAALRALYDDAGEPYPGDDEALTQWHVEPITRAHLSRLVVRVCR